MSAYRGRVSLLGSKGGVVIAAVGMLALGGAVAFGAIQYTGRAQIAGDHAGRRTAPWPRTGRCWPCRPRTCRACPTCASAWTAAT